MEDILILSWDCRNCVKVKSILNENAIFDNDFITNSGSKFHVIYTFNSNSTRWILDKLGMNNSFAPAILTSDGSIIDSKEDIISYIKRCINK